MNTKKKFTKINFLHLILILSAALLLTWLIVPKGHLFGSETDWYCQHVNIADAMRKQFFVSGKWFPDFTELGGGTNFYTLAYYGFFRPDVFLGYFLPWVSTETLVQGYAIFEILLGAGLFLFLAHKKEDFKCRRFYSRDSLYQRELPFSGSQAAYVCKLSAIFTPFLSLPG